jgi:hypothetical protein
MSLNRLYFITLAFLLLCATGLFAQQPRYSTASEVGREPCFDTLKVFGVKTIQDINRLMPTWVPVAGRDTCVVLEGMIKSGVDKYGTYNGPIVSYEDMPLFHYTHDLCFNIYPDSAYQHMLAYQVFTGKETHIVEGFDSKNKPGDTTRQKDVHVEWECGLGAGNKGNPCAELNKQGKSCGFATAGHERGDIIWNWPTTGDWVHVEGLWIWDRGHPPAEAEVHPMRFMAIRRGLPAKLPSGHIATEVDMYASGDGGAFYNNRPKQPNYVYPVKMSGRSYTFTVSNTIAKPTPGAKLQARIEKAKGNTYAGEIDLDIDAEKGTCRVTIPWKDADTAVLASKLFLYWDVPSDTAAFTKVDVHIKKLKILRRKEFMGRSEFRVFMDVGGQWVFLNDLYGTKKDILNKGLGKTFRRNFKINKHFTLYVPKGKDFRVYVTGWEADGMELSLGHVVNDNSPCDENTKQMLRKSDAINLKQTVLHGCLDDMFGEAAVWHKAEEAGAKQNYKLKPQKGRNIDVCPCSKFKNEKGYKLYYSIEKVN